MAGQLFGELLHLAPMNGEAVMGRYFSKFMPLTLALAMTGCGLVRANETSRMDANQIQQVSNRDLCNPHVNSRVADMERERRGLGDCRPATNPGLGANNPIWGQMLGVGAQMANPPRYSPTITTTTCQNVGNTTFCNGVAQ